MSQTTRVAIISGGLGGIGQAVARQLADDGHSIALFFYPNPPAEAEAFIRGLSGSGHLALACDLRREDDVRLAVNQVGEQMGKIDACVHAAVSPLVRKRAAVISPADFKEQFEVTLFGGLNLFQAVIPWLQKQKSGRLIGLTSAALEPNQPVSSMAGYICAKHALRGLLRDLAKELVADGISVHAVAPGFVPTPLHNDLPPRLIELLQDKHPLKKLTTPEDVARVVAWLCSEQAAGLTGLSVPVGLGEAMTL